MPSRRWIIFLTLALAYFLVYFHRLSLSVVADDLVKEFETTAGAMGLLGSLYFYGYALMQLPAGLLSDSLGPRRTVTFSLLFAAAGSLLFGSAPNLWVAFLGRALVGLGVSMVFIPTMKILSQWFLPREFAFMAGLLNGVGGVGVLAATFFLALMAGRLGWRLSFLLIGLGTLGLVFGVWRVVRDRPEEGPRPAEAEAGGVRIPLLAGMRRVAMEKSFWPVAVWFFFNCGIFFGFGGLWAGPYLMHVYGLTKTQTGAVLSLIAWGMIFGSPLLGLISDRWVQSRRRVLTACSAVLTAELALLCLFPAGLSTVALCAVFFVFSVSSSAIVSVAFTATKELFPVEIAGTSTGMVNLFPFLGGAVYMPLLGRVLDSFDRTAQGGFAPKAYTVLLAVLLVSSLVSLACTRLMKETHPARLKADAPAKIKAISKTENKRR